MSTIRNNTKQIENVYPLIRNVDVIGKSAVAHNLDALVGGAFPVAGVRKLFNAKTRSRQDAKTSFVAAWRLCDLALRTRVDVGSFR